MALAACTSHSGPSTTTTTSAAPTSTTVVATSTTLTTLTAVLVGTTPWGERVTQTSTHVFTTPAGPDGIALESGAPIGSLDPAIQGQTIDAIQCNRIDQLAYQTYAHLLIEVNGQPRALPGAIGMVNPRPSVYQTTTTYTQNLCAYWLMTRAANGIVQVHSPIRRTFTLGEFFDVWGEPLNSRNVAGVSGRVTAMVDGRRVRGNPRAIPLREHEAIQLAVGTPVPRFQPVSWTNTSL